MEHLPTETIKVLSTPLTSAGLKIRRLFLPPQSIKSCFSSFSHQNRTEELNLSFPFPLSRSHSILYDFQLGLEACCICLCPWSTSYFSFIAHSESSSHNSTLLRLANLISWPFTVDIQSGNLLEKPWTPGFSCSHLIVEAPFSSSTGASSFLPHCQGHD